MRIFIRAISMVALFALAACQTGAERAAEADADIKEERLKFLERYKACASQYQDQPEKLQSCEHYLKAVEAMK